MQYLLLVYTDPDLLAALPAEEYDRLMRGCLEHAAELQARGILLAAQKLEPPTTARTVRSRHGLSRVTDGPFAETKEILAGFNLIEAPDIETAVQVAHEFPWIHYGSLEVRALHDMQGERQRVGATGAPGGL
ncbi:hypothetical protein CSC70_03320 [Pseudoxanthomonas kalamensis DSM 18571]|uniref:YciI family protein n=1 Tax=Pseudoxanthomonas kalamensis TaxID=289483 RepID=UPI001391EAF9|nr:YciI family protein [Pseudoxanthomonas kalamensis]KAF1712702.1 hypothetical protein CSC70_03320 [Pseudoxanthomonas kalamensis DSM 18571]